jgi:hypothetical protein
MTLAHLGLVVLALRPPNFARVHQTLRSTAAMEGELQIIFVDGKKSSRSGLDFIPVVAQHWIFSPLHNMNIKRRFWELGFLCCLILSAGCASVSNQTPSVDQLQQRAANGDRVAQRLLGVAYDFGQGAQQNYAEAAKWYQLAADQGDAIAENNLGSLYEHGLGVPEDYSKSIVLYRKSAGQGFAIAQNSLGRMYDLGMGVTANYAEANKWYLFAAEQGDAEAMFNLGKNHGFGRGVPQDRVQAFMWLDLARFFTQHSPDMKTKWTIRRALDDLKVYMTPEEIKEGERLSKNWYDDYREKHKST